MTGCGGRGGSTGCLPLLHRDGWRKIIIVICLWLRNGEWEGEEGEEGGRNCVHRDTRTHTHTHTHTQYNVHVQCTYPSWLSIHLVPEVEENMVVASE